MKVQTQVTAGCRSVHVLVAALGLLLSLAVLPSSARAAGPVLQQASLPPAAIKSFSCAFQVPPFSEEGTGSQFCPGAFRRIFCTGDNCDNLSLECCDQPAVPGTGNFVKTIFVSEEQPQGVICPDKRFARGAFCQGSYCDDVALLCESPGAIKGACRWSDFFSEENGGVGGCFANEVVAGIKCQGNYCDDLSLYCCVP